MNSTYVKIGVFVLIVGLLTACGAPATNTPASSPTGSVPLDTQAPTYPPVSTAAAAPTDTAVATELATQGAPVSFAHDVLPIMESRCANCHGGDRVEKGLNLKTYAELMAVLKMDPWSQQGTLQTVNWLNLLQTRKCQSAAPSSRLLKSRSSLNGSTRAR